MQAWTRDCHHSRDLPPENEHCICMPRVTTSRLVLVFSSHTNRMRGRISDGQSLSALLTTRGRWSQYQDLGVRPRGARGEIRKGREGAVRLPKILVLTFTCRRRGSSRSTASRHPPALPPTTKTATGLCRGRSTRGQKARRPPMISTRI